MQTPKITTLLFSIFIGVAMMSMGCASPTVYQMQSGERTAGAEGELTITSDDNGNQLVALTVAHLPQPSRLDQQLATYVVWLSPKDSGQRYNVGRIQLGDDRTGTLQFTTAFDAYDLMITGEAKPTEMSPSDHVVLRHAVGQSSR